MAFRGTFDYTLDAKNRLTVPAKFRAQLSDGVVLAKGLDRCVAIWRPEHYEAQIEQALEGRNPMGPDARNLRRFFSANALDTELDSAGRVMLPGFLMEHAQLGREVVVTGAGDSLEVWERDEWASYNERLSADVPEITAGLDPSP